MDREEKRIVLEKYRQPGVEFPARNAVKGEIVLMNSETMRFCFPMFCFCPAKEVLN